MYVASQCMFWRDEARMYPHPDARIMLVDEATYGTAARHACCQTSAAAPLLTLLALTSTALSATGHLQAGRC